MHQFESADPVTDPNNSLKLVISKLSLKLQNRNHIIPEDCTNGSRSSPLCKKEFRDDEIPIT